MKSKLIFYPAGIQSHVIPAMSLASQLKSLYEIYVLVADESLAKMVREHNFHPILISRFKVGAGHETGYLRAKNRKHSAWHVLLAMRKNMLYHDKIAELNTAAGHLTPAAIIVDIFNSSELFPIKAAFPKTALICFNPMLSTYKVDNYPTVSEPFWPKANSRTTGSVRKSHTRSSIPGIRSLFTWVYTNQLKALLSHSKLGETNKVAENVTYTMLFNNIPEIIVAPLELELSPEVKMSTQHYLGLCLNTDRIDLDVDNEFREQFDRILKKRDAGAKIVYCSFGTFYEDSNPAVVQFLSSIIRAIESLPYTVEVVFSIKAQTKQTLTHYITLPANIHFFNKVPQLKVLEHADLHITHGGLGSIKESIYYNVPMLVYPLDYNYDQNGNGLKIDHHRLGMRGVFNQDTPSMIAEKMQKLLHDGTYKKALEQFNLNLLAKYPDDVVIRTISNLIHSDEPI